MSQAVYSLSDPAENFAAVTPHDTTNFNATTPKAGLTRALYVGGAGNVAAVREDGTAVTFVGVTAGTVLPVRCIRVNSTGTTATGLVRLW